MQFQKIKVPSSQFVCLHINLIRMLGRGFESTTPPSHRVSESNPAYLWTLVSLQKL